MTPPPERLRAPTLGVGCVRLGSVSEGNGWNADVRLVRGAIDAGVTTFDTADVYGNGMSERILGAALRGRRDDVRIATKVGYVHRDRSPGVYRGLRMASRLRRLVRGAGSSSIPPDAAAPAPSRPSYQRQDFSASYLTRAVEASLVRLRTDHVDVLFLHGPPNVMTDVLDALEPLRASGKVLRIGVGAESHASAAAWLASPVAARIDVVQLPFGLLDPGSPELLDAIDATGVDVWARGVLGAGLLPLPSMRPVNASDRSWAMAGSLERLAAERGVDVVELAFAYVRSLRAVSTTLVGVRSLSHLADDVRMFEGSSVDPLIVAEAAAIIARWDVSDERQ